MAGDILLGSYSPEEVVVIISAAGTTHQVTGFADGQFISATRLVPASTNYIGADLTGGRTKRRNRSTNVTFTLHQYAASNLFLDELQRADENDSGNRYLASVTIKDNSGQTLMFSSQAVISTTPDITFGTEQEMRSWEIFMFNASGIIGGNTLVDQSTVQAIETLGGEVDARWQV